MSYNPRNHVGNSSGSEEFPSLVALEVQSARAIRGRKVSYLVTQISRKLRAEQLCVDVAGRGGRFWNSRTTTCALAMTYSAAFMGTEWAEATCMENSTRTSSDAARVLSSCSSEVFWKFVGEERISPNPVLEYPSIELSMPNYK